MFYSVLVQPCVRVCLGIIQFNGSSKLVTQSYECYLLSFYNSSKKVLCRRQYTVGMSPASVHPSRTHTANGKIAQYLNEDHTVYLQSNSILFNGQF